MKKNSSAVKSAQGAKARDTKHRDYQMAVRNILAHSIVARNQYHHIRAWGPQALPHALFLHVEELEAYRADY